LAGFDITPTDALTDIHGNFTAWIKVPVIVPGQYEIIASDGLHEVSTIFGVEFNASRDVESPLPSIQILSMGVLYTKTRGYQFTIRTNGSIPLRDSMSTIAFSWKLDLDRNESTGWHTNDIGNDFAVYATLAPWGWGEGPTGPTTGERPPDYITPEIKVLNNSVYVWLQSPSLWNVKEFYWVAQSFSSPPNPILWADWVPSTGHVVFPRNPSGRINVTTNINRSSIYINGFYAGKGAVQVFGIPEGKHIISFGSVEGYYTPSNQEILVSEGSTVEVLAIYTAAPVCSCLVVRGLDNRIYYRVYNSSSDFWGSWNVLPGATCDSPAAAVCGNELHMVVRDMGGSALYHGYVDLATNAFSGWTLISGATPSAPTLTSNGSVLSLVVRGWDNRIYYRTYTFSPRSWGSWNVLTGATCDGPAAAMLGNNLHIVVRGLDGNTLYHIVVQPNVGVARDWLLISGATPSKPALTANQATNKLYLAVRGFDNKIYWRTYDGPTDTWGSWGMVPTGATCDGIGATVIGETLHVVVRGMDGYTIWHGIVDLTDNFPGWTLISGATPSVPTLTS
jgi:hypothetical protein